MALLAAPQAGDADLARVDRTIGKEPAYVGKPLYALFIFDREAKTRIWAVLDKSKADLDYYDVLYFDKNGNGNLTDDGERFTGTYNKEGEAAGVALRIRPGDLKIGGLTHTGLEFSTVSKKGRVGIWFRMHWSDQHEISGGYSQVGFETTVYGDSPKTAPILRPTPEGTLSFGLYTWGEKGVSLKIGAAGKVYIIVGCNGTGSDTLCAVTENFLDLSKDELVATLITKDTEGRELKVRTVIKEHC